MGRYRSLVKVGRVPAISATVAILALSFGVFQNCSKKGTANTNTNGTAGYTPKKVSASESFGFGVRGPASVSFIRSVGRLSASALTQANDQLLISGSVERSGDKKAALVRLGLDGQLQSATVVSGPGQEELRGQALDGSGRWIAVGSSRHHSTSGFRRDGLLVVDDQGSISAKVLSAGVVTGLAAVSAQTDAIVVGYASDNVRSEIKTPFVASLDGNQHVVWSGRLAGLESGEFLAVTRANNEIVAVGYHGKSKALIARYTQNGLLIGASSLPLGDSSQALAVIESPDGGLLVAGATSLRGQEKGFIAKLSASQSLEWVSVSENEGRIHDVKLSPSGQIIALGSMVTELGVRNVVSFRISLSGTSIGQSALGGQAATYVDGQALSVSEAGIRVVANSTTADGSHNPLALVNLDRDFSDCEFVRPSSSSFVPISGKLRDLSARMVNANAQTQDAGGSLADLDVAGDGQCF